MGLKEVWQITDFEDFLFLDIKNVEIDKGM